MVNTTYTELVEDLAVMAMDDRAEYRRLRSLMWAAKCRAARAREAAGVPAIRRGHEN